MKKTIIRSLVVMSAIIALLDVSCKSQTSPGIPTLLSIEASPDRLSVEAGSLLQVKITATYRETGRKILASANFTSANSSVVSVDEQGWIKAGVAGSANVSVSYKEGEVTKTAVIPVTVTGAIAHNPNGGVYVSE